MDMEREAEMLILNNKRAQFFLVAAFILAAVLIGLSKINNMIILPSQPFSREDVRKEFERESRLTLNHALYQHKNAQEVMENFSQSYVLYARSKMKESQYFFLYADAEQVSLFAFGDSSQIAATMDTPFSFVQQEDDFYKAIKARTGNEVNVTFYGSDYTISLQERDFYPIMRVRDGGAVYVLQ